MSEEPKADTGVTGDDKLVSLLAYVLTPLAPIIILLPVSALLILSFIFTIVPITNTIEDFELTGDTLFAFIIFLGPTLTCMLMNIFGWKNALTSGPGIQL